MGSWVRERNNSPPRALARHPSGSLDLNPKASRKASTKASWGTTGHALRWPIAPVTPPAFRT
eukprot:10232557-Alexandrium_andersonii.AAC.1